METESRPLFPLHTVLFPGARLHLRIFERRYLDMVSDCCRNGGTFGVCAIVEGQEAGAPAVPAGFGCEARIVDFEALPDGLLGITVEGERRFEVTSTRVQDDGLLVAQVGWRHNESRSELAIEHELLATLLRRCLERLGGPHAHATSEFGDAAWVSWRLAELLPLALGDRQMLLEESDPNMRMHNLLALVAALQPE